MSADHALMSFTQREDQIQGAKRRLINDADSFNDNNPNAVGHQIQLKLHLEPIDSDGASRSRRNPAIGSEDYHESASAIVVISGPTLPLPPSSRSLIAF